MFDRVDSKTLNANQNKQHRHIETSSTETTLPHRKPSQELRDPALMSNRSELNASKRKHLSANEQVKPLSIASAPKKTECACSIHNDYARSIAEGDTGECGVFLCVGREHTQCCCLFSVRSSAHASKFAHPSNRTVMPPSSYIFDSNASVEVNCETERHMSETNQNQRGTSSIYAGLSEKNVNARYHPKCTESESDSESDIGD